MSNLDSQKIVVHYFKLHFPNVVISLHFGNISPFLIVVGRAPLEKGRTPFFVIKGLKNENLKTVFQLLRGRERTEQGIEKRKSLPLFPKTTSEIFENFFSKKRTEKGER